MRVSAAILALSSMLPQGSSNWVDDPVAHHSLEAVAANVSAARLADQAAIITDDQALIDLEVCGGVAVRPCPENMRFHPFNFLSVEAYKVGLELDMLRAVGLEAEVALLVSATLPMLGAVTLERLYHALLEDPLAGRVLPLAKVDPQLYARLPGEEGFFPVWAHRGMDRQRIPQLYRCRMACAVHVDRLTKTLPTIKGVHVSRLELVEVRTAKDMELVRFLRNRATRPEAC